MKILTFIFSMLLLAAFMTAGAQTATKTYPKVSDTGVWTDANGTYMGSIDSSGFLKDSSNAAFGKVEKVPHNPGVYAFNDAAGNELATILEDGTVRDLRGAVIYTVYPPDATGYCTVRGDAGKTVGLVHMNYKHSGVCLMQSNKIIGGNRLALQQSAR